MYIFSFQVLEYGYRTLLCIQEKEYACIFYGTRRKRLLFNVMQRPYQFFSNSLISLRYLMSLLLIESLPTFI